MSADLHDPNTCRWTRRDCEDFSHSGSDYIASLREQVAALTRERDRLQGIARDAAEAATEHQREVLRLRAELDALKRQEPVAWAHGGFEWHPSYRAQSEQVVKLTRAAQLQYGFTMPLYAAPTPAAADAEALPWVPAHERVPAPGTECVVLLRYTLDGPAFVGIDKWDVQHEDPIGMGGPTIETGEGWNDNDENDVIAWFPVPPRPPAEWDQRLPDDGAALAADAGRAKTEDKS